jgi:hypothetical protein
MVVGMVTTDDYGTLKRPPRFRWYRRWVVGLVLLLLVAGGVAIWQVETAPGIYTDGLTPVQPSPLQLAAMGEWYQRHYAPGDFAGSPGGIGCVVYSMATRQLSGGESMAYTQVMCEQCPPSGLGGATPVAFHLDGTKVTRAGVADAPGDPMSFDQIRRYFPRQLWNTANSQQIPNVELYVAAAYQVARCTG